jgi:hypothetical protein
VNANNSSPPPVDPGQHVRDCAFRNIELDSKLPDASQTRDVAPPDLRNLLTGQFAIPVIPAERKCSLVAWLSIALQTEYSGHFFFLAGADVEGVFGTATARNARARRTSYMAKECSLATFTRLSKLLKATSHSTLTEDWFQHL